MASTLSLEPLLQGGSILFSETSIYLFKPNHGHSRNYLVLPNQKRAQRHTASTTPFLFMLSFLSYEGHRSFDREILTISSYAFYDIDIDTIFDEIAAIRSIPSIFQAISFVEQHAPAAEDTPSS